MNIIEKNSIPELNSGCWIWLRGVQNYGRYGAVEFNNKRMTAHHCSHLIYKGLVPKKWHVDHLCRNGLCVNPDHLEAVPVGLNIQRAYPMRCKRGHLLTLDNIILITKRKYQRRCKTCHRENMAKYRKPKNEIP